MTKLMKYGLAGILPGLIGTLVLSGRAFRYLPRPDSIDPQKIPALIKQTIAIENTQDDSTEFTIGQAGVRKMTGDLHAWTATARQLVKTEFEKRDITVVENAPKVLSLSIVRAELGVYGPKYVGLPKCIVNLEVNTGSGYTRKINIVKKHLSPVGACDSAITAAVSAMFMDAGLLKYIYE